MQLDLPLGLNHVLLCSGSTSKDVYRVLYWQLRASAVGVGYKTFVFSEWVCELLRARFGATGMYDHQYEGRQDVYIVTDADLAGSHWRGPPDECEFCSLEMPSTP